MIEFLEAHPDEPVPLPQHGDLPPTNHLFEQRAIDAINAALAAGRPLLLRGLPGVGKSQLARAAAAKLKRAFVSRVVDAQVESDDLKWRFDTVERLAQAQLQHAIGANERQARENLAADRFLTPGPLWWAFDWASAAEQAQRIGAAEPETPAKWQPNRGCVLLIDEIDKADSSVPNGLLEALGAGVFDAPGGIRIARCEGQAQPLVIVTTNEERVLPDAFLRRCLVLHLSLPEKPDELVELLVRRGRAHHPSESEISSSVLQDAARLLADDRRSVRGRQLCPPGQAEFLDLCRAVVALAPGDEAAQGALLSRLRRFVFDKHPTTDEA